MWPWDKQQAEQEAALAVASVRERARKWVRAQRNEPDNGSPASSTPAAVAGGNGVPVATAPPPPPRFTPTASESAVPVPQPLLPAVPPVQQRLTFGRALLAALRWLFVLKLKVLLIERYLWNEAFGHFMLGTMGFSFFMVVTTIFALGDKIFSKNIPPFTVAKILLLNAPGVLVLAIPVAVVFSTLMAMGRLNRDNELVALQTNGVSLYRIFIPFLTLAVLAGLGSWLIYERIVPKSNTDSLEILKVFWKAQVVDFIKPGIVISAPQQKYFYVDSIRKDIDTDGIMRSTMYNIRLYDYYKESGGLRNYPRVFVGKRAWVNDQFLVLSDVTLYSLDERTGSNLVSAHMPEIEIDIGTRIVDFSLDPQAQQLGWSALRDRILRTRERIRSSGAMGSYAYPQYLSDWTEYYLKFSIPFACLSFVLVAVPVSLRGPRDERNMGIILSFVLMMIYYIIFFSARTLGHRGLLLPSGLHLFGHQLLPGGVNLFPPYVAGWLTPALFMIAAVVLIRKARK